MLYKHKYIYAYIPDMLKKVDLHSVARALAYRHNHMYM